MDNKQTPEQEEGGILPEDVTIIPAQTEPAEDMPVIEKLTFTEEPPVTAETTFTENVPAETVIPAAVEEAPTAPETAPIPEAPAEEAVSFMDRIPNVDED